jgi:hypothetical protein
MVEEPVKKEVEVSEEEGMIEAEEEEKNEGDHEEKQRI